MDISINNNHGVNKADFEVETPAVQPNGNNAEKPLLSISNISADEESSIGSDIPDTALSRQDALGKLVNSAFNLPPPPMPQF